MARKTKHKYPRRPWNDGEHWVDGVWHSRPRQRRADPLAPENQKRIHTPTHTPGHIGPEHTTRWRPISLDTFVELIVRGTLDPDQARQILLRSDWDMDEFRGEFMSAVKAQVEAGQCENPMAIFERYRSCFVA